MGPSMAAKLVLLPIVLAPALRMTRRRTILMRDSSSVTWFKAGDRVRVSESVMSRGQDLRGRTGTVADAWEKCEEDPHCCCAELAEEAAAVTVDLDPPDARQYYFAENELAKLPVRAAAAVGTPSSGNVATGPTGVTAAKAGAPAWNAIKHKFVGGPYAGAAGM